MQALPHAPPLLDWNLAYLQSRISFVFSFSIKSKRMASQLPLARRIIITSYLMLFISLSNLYIRYFTFKILSRLIFIFHSKISARSACISLNIIYSITII